MKYTKAELEAALKSGTVCGGVIYCINDGAKNWTDGYFEDGNSEVIEHLAKRERITYERKQAEIYEDFGIVTK